MNNINIFQKELYLNNFVEDLYNADKWSLSFFFEGSNLTYVFTINWEKFYLREINERWSKENIENEVSLLNELSELFYIPKLLKISWFRKDIKLINDFIFKSWKTYYTSTKWIDWVKFTNSSNELNDLWKVMWIFHNKTMNLIDKFNITDKRIKNDIKKTMFQNRSLSIYYERSCEKNWYIENIIVKNVKYIDLQIEKILHWLDWKINDLDETIIHNDLTPNNLLTFNKKIIWILDYEYISLRENLYDLAWTIATTCYWEKNDWILDKKKIEILVNSYFWNKWKSISNKEKYIIFHFMKLWIIAAIKWTADQYFEYWNEKIRNFERNIKLLKWLDDKDFSFL